MSPGGLVLLPGLDGTGHLFRPLLQSLPAHIARTVVSYPGDRRLDLEGLAVLVARRLPENAVLLAESFSGLVALTLLKRRLAPIRGLILVGAFAEPPRPYLLRFATISARPARMMRAAPAFLLRRYCLGSDAAPAEIALLREALSAVSPSVIAQRLALVAARHDFGKAAFDVPALYLRGTGDRLVPSSCADWFQRRFSDFALRELAGPHFLLQTRAREASGVISAALSA